MIQNSLEEVKNFSQFKYAWYKKGKYSVNTKSYLTLDTGKANETETSEIWELAPGEYNHMDLVISDREYIQADAQMKPFYEILDKVNTATSHLSLVLNDDKTIDTVENQTEITEKWEEIKKKELRFLQLMKDSYNELITIYDKEFSRIETNLQLNLLYQIMFYPFPDVGINLEEEGEFKDREILSVLFPGEKIEYSSSYKLAEASDGYQVNFTGKLKNHSENIQEMYAKKFEHILEISLAYDFFIEGEYRYNNDSVLSEVIVHLKEQLNDKMLYVCRYHIQLIK